MSAGPWCWGRRQSAALAALLLVALGLRLAVALTRPPHPVYPDSAQYLAMASNVRAGEGPIINARMRTFRAPLFPLLVAGVETVLGPGLTRLRCVLAVIGALLPALLLAWTRWLGWSQRSGWLAATGAAVWPHFLYFSALVLTESLFMLLLCAALWALQAARETPTLRRSMAAGALLGLATLTRFSVGPMVVWLAPLWVGRAPRRWRSLALIGLGWALVLSPWWVRNARLYGHFVPFSTHLGHHLWEVLGPQATGGPMVDEIDWPDGTHRLPDNEMDRMLKRATLAHLRSDPMQLFRLMPVKMARYWNPIPNDPGHRRPLLIVVSLASVGLVFLLAPIGLWWLWGRRPVWALLLPIAYFCVLHATISMGSVRYRIPLEPILLMFAAVAVDQLLARGRRAAAQPDQRRS